VLERVVSGHGEIALRQSGADFEIISNGTFLMDTRDGRSERLLVREALAGCASPAPRILIAGLGVGFSLAEAVDRAGAAAIDVIEISPEIIRWHGSYLRHIAAAAWADARVTVINADVVPWLAHVREPYDAICLDVDNGPGWTVRDANQALYGDEGLGRLRAALTPGGSVAVWSAAAAPGFERRLRRHFTGVRACRVPVARGEPDVVYVANCSP
jgi:spermidine synthase